MNARANTSVSQQNCQGVRMGSASSVTARESEGKIDKILQRNIDMCNGRHPRLPACNARRRVSNHPMAPKPTHLHTKQDCHSCFCPISGLCALLELAANSGRNMGHHPAPCNHPGPSMPSQTGTSSDPTETLGKVSQEQHGDAGLREKGQGWKPAHGHLAPLLRLNLFWPRIGSTKGF